MKKYYFYKDMAEHLGVTIATVSKYKCNKLIPEPDAVIDGKQCWTRETVKNTKVTKITKNPLLQREYIKPKYYDLAFEGMRGPQCKSA